MKVYILQNLDNSLVRKGVLTSKAKAEAFVQKLCGSSKLFFDWIDNCAAAKTEDERVHYWITRKQVY